MSLLPARRRILNAFWWLAMAPVQLIGWATGRCPAAPPLGEPWPILHAEKASNAGLGNGAGPIVAFGDSLTEGFGVRPEEAWPMLLGRMLGREVINRGRSGDSSADGLARLRADVLSLNPALVLVGFGGNDLLARRSLKEWEADMTAIVAELHAAGCCVVLLGLRGSWLYRIDMDAPIRALAKRRGCGLVACILDGIWGRPWLMIDAAHPNTRGHLNLCRRVATYARKNIL